MLPFDDVIMNCEVMSYSQPNIPERSAPAAELNCDVDCDQSSRDHIDFFLHYDVKVYLTIICGFDVA